MPPVSMSSKPQVNITAIISGRKKLSTAKNAAQIAPIIRPATGK